MFAPYEDEALHLVYLISLTDSYAPVVNGTPEAYALSIERGWIDHGGHLTAIGSEALEMWNRAVGHNG